MADTQILTALTAALDARGFAGVEPQLAPIEPPRDWGVTTNVCFALAGRAAQEQIAEQTAGLDKKEAKALAGQITREAGPKLAAELAVELTAALGASVGAELDSARDGASTAGADVLPPYATQRLIARVEAEGAYINFYYDPTALAGEVVSAVLGRDPAGLAGRSAKPGEEQRSPATQYGAGAPTGKRIMVEYAQPNTHKDFHVGHLRNASIGQAIANLLEFDGNEVLKATYLGDIGAHVAKAIWAHEEFGPAASNGSQPPEGSALEYWQGCYRQGNDAAAESPSILAQQRDWLGRWESGDPHARSIWQSSRDACVDEFRSIFETLKVSFDEPCWFYESTVDDSHLGQQTAEELKQRGIAVVDTSEEYKGALYVDFEQHADSPVFRDDERKRIRKLGKMTILRSDGTSLYQTKELGLAKYKFDHFDIDESLYVVGSEQKLYFEQVFAILRLWGFPNAENCKHIAYELVVLPEGKMSSREGTVVSYRELRDEAVRRALVITREKGIVAPGQDLEQTAKDIAIAAIKYAMLQVSGNQQIVFDFEQALSFDGRAAPYLQYAYARAGKLVGDAARVGQVSVPVQDSAQSIASSGQAGTPLPPIPPADLKASEIALVRQLHGWPAACRLAAQRYEPAVIANYLYELASAFNDFYRDCRVLDAPDDIRPWRQGLTAAFRTVMRTGFGLLALPLPEAM